MLMGFYAPCWLPLYAMRTAEAGPGDWNFPLLESLLFSCSSSGLGALYEMMGEKSLPLNVQSSKFTGNY